MFVGDAVVSLHLNAYGPVLVDLNPISKHTFGALSWGVELNAVLNLVLNALIVIQVEASLTLLADHIVGVLKTVRSQVFTPDGHALVVFEEEVGFALGTLVDIRVSETGNDSNRIGLASFARICQKKIGKTSLALVFNDFVLQALRQK